MPPTDTDADCDGRDEDEYAADALGETDGRGDADDEPLPDEELVDRGDDDPLVDTDGEPETLNVFMEEAVCTEVPDTELDTDDVTDF